MKKRVASLTLACLVAFSLVFGGVFSLSGSAAVTNHTKVYDLYSYGMETVSDSGVTLQYNEGPAADVIGGTFGGKVVRPSKTTYNVNVGEGTVGSTIVDPAEGSQAYLFYNDGNTTSPNAWGYASPKENDTIGGTLVMQTGLTGFKINLYQQYGTFADDANEMKLEVSDKQDGTYREIAVKRTLVEDELAWTTLYVYEPANATELQSTDCYVRFTFKKQGSAPYQEAWSYQIAGFSYSCAETEIYTTIDLTDATPKTVMVEKDETSFIQFFSNQTTVSPRTWGWSTDVAATSQWGIFSSADASMDFDLANAKFFASYFPGFLPAADANEVSLSFSATQEGPYTPVDVKRVADPNGATWCSSVIYSAADPSQIVEGARYVKFELNYEKNRDVAYQVQVSHVMLGRAVSEDGTTKGYYTYRTTGMTDFKAQFNFKAGTEDQPVIKAYVADTDRADAFREIRLNRIEGKLENAPAPKVPVEPFLKLEAESAEMVVLENCPTINHGGGASGGQYIGNLNLEGCGLKFAVNVAEAGNYDLMVRYASPADFLPSAHVLKVNDVDCGKITYNTPTAGWGAFGDSATVSVPLNAGDNVIYIGRGGDEDSYAEIDYITLTPEGYVPPEQPENVVDPDKDWDSYLYVPAEGEELGDYLKIEVTHAASNADDACLFMGVSYDYEQDSRYLSIYNIKDGQGTPARADGYIKVTNPYPEVVGGQHAYQLYGVNEGYVIWRFENLENFRIFVSGVSRDAMDVLKISVASKDVDAYYAPIATKVERGWRSGGWANYAIVPYDANDIPEGTKYLRIDGTASGHIIMLIEGDIAGQGQKEQIVVQPELGTDMAMENMEVNSKGELEVMDSTQAASVVLPAENLSWFKANFRSTGLDATNLPVTFSVAETEDGEFVPVETGAIPAQSNVGEAARYEYATKEYLEPDTYHFLKIDIAPLGADASLVLEKLVYHHTLITDKLPAFKECPDDQTELMDTFEGTHVSDPERNGLAYDSTMVEMKYTAYGAYGEEIKIVQKVDPDVDAYVIYEAEETLKYFDVRALRLSDYPNTDFTFSVSADGSYWESLDSSAIERYVEVYDGGKEGVAYRSATLPVNMKYLRIEFPILESVFLDEVGLTTVQIFSGAAVPVDEDEESGNNDDDDDDVDNDDFNGTEDEELPPPTGAEHAGLVCVAMAVMSGAYLLSQLRRKSE